MRGGKPGYFPTFSQLPHPVPFNLFDPFGLSKNATPEKKVRRAPRSQPPPTPPCVLAWLAWLMRPMFPHGLHGLFALCFHMLRRPLALQAKGLLAEINNGRLAQIGLFGFLAESQVPGSVPGLATVGIKGYSGDIMAPFDANFHIF